ncbi:MAG: hypothetical protein ACK4EY_16165 [Flavipsychrobacter sp.]
MGSKKGEELKAALRRMLQNDPVISGTVKSVDKEKRTCIVALDGGMELYDVMLTALKEAPKGAVNIPATGSEVQMVAIGDADFLVIAIEEVDEVQWDIAGTKLEVKKDLFQINGGSNGAMVVIGKLVGRMNKVEKALKDLQTKFNNHVHTTTATIGASTAPGAIAPTTTKSTLQVTETKEDDIANKKVKH